MYRGVGTHIYIFQREIYLAIYEKKYPDIDNRYLKF